MEFLRLLENIRSPFMDELFLLITRFGEEIIFVVIGMILFWCIDKKKGYYVLLVGFSGLLINQFLKITCRVARPWVKDPTLKTVEAAKGAATGYSFPSGHTQISVGAYGSIGRAFKNRILRIICITMCVLVPFSRMYLGVHTPYDVAVSVIIALLLIFVLYPIVMKAVEDKTKMRMLLLIMTILSIMYLFYVELVNFGITDVEGTVNYMDAVENSYKVLGAICGVWAGYEIDMKFIRFETKARWWAQILKLVLGLIPVLFIMKGLKVPLQVMFNGNHIADGTRYFLVTLFACGIWPWTFKFFKK